MSKDIILLSKFRPGPGSCFLVKIQDAYRHKGKWYYDVDASCYQIGFELEFVSEDYITKRNYEDPTKRIPSRLLKRLSNLNQ